MEWIITFTYYSNWNHTNEQDLNHHIFGQEKHRSHHPDLGFRVLTHTTHDLTYSQVWWRHHTWEYVRSCVTRTSSRVAPILGWSDFLLWYRRNGLTVRGFCRMLTDAGGCWRMLTVRGSQHSISVVLCSTRVSFLVANQPHIRRHHTHEISCFYVTFSCT